MRGVLGLVMCTAVLVAPVSAQQGPLEDRQEALERYRSGVRLMAEEKFEAAARDLRESTRLAPAFVLAHYELGRSLMALDRYPEAAVSLTTCRDLILSLDQGQLGAADQLAQSAWQTSPYAHYSAVPIGQMIVLRAHQNLKGLSSRAGEAKPRVPAEVHLALGSALYHQGHVEDAESEFRAAIAEDPGLGPAHNNLAAICMQTGRLDEARREIEEAEKAGYVVSQRFKGDLERRTQTARGSEAN